MDAKQFKNIIKTSVREVIREELEIYFSSKFGGTPNISQKPNITEKISYSPKPDISASRNKLLQEIDELYPKRQREVPQIETPTKSIFENLLAETAGEMNRNDFSDMNNLGSVE